jgi:pimeloyl-ACP methyl ester carboxylesterase
MTEIQPELSFFDWGEGTRLAYRLRPGSAPTLVFLPGYASDMDGSKAVALDAFAGRRGLAMLRFDYSGTGASGGRFEDGTLDGWLNEALAMIEQLTDGPLILIGSSMGGWLAVHLAMRLAGRVDALVGIATAPDFTDWGFTAEQKDELQRSAKIEWIDSDSGERRVAARAFWESGEAMHLLDSPIAVDCPVRLVHGDADRVVPLRIVRSLMRQLRSADVQLNILKGGGHRLSEPNEIEAIARTVTALLEPAP